MLRNYLWISEKQDENKFSFEQLNVTCSKKRFCKLFEYERWKNLDLKLLTRIISLKPMSLRNFIKAIKLLFQQRELVSTTDVFTRSLSKLTFKYLNVPLHSLLRSQLFPTIIISHSKMFSSVIKLHSKTENFQNKFTFMNQIIGSYKTFVQSQVSEIRLQKLAIRKFKVNTKTR